jgi:hypothetical protein
VNRIANGKHLPGGLAAGARRGVLLGLVSLCWGSSDLWRAEEASTVEAHVLKVQMRKIQCCSCKQIAQAQTREGIRGCSLHRYHGEAGA